MTKCTKCIRGARIRATGVSPENKTLRIDLGGAVVYIQPGNHGTVDVAVDTENLLDGDYAAALWSGDEWIITRK